MKKRFIIFLIIGVFLFSLLSLPSSYPVSVSTENKLINLNSPSENPIPLNSETNNKSPQSPYCEPAGWCESKNYESNEGPGKPDCCSGTYEECINYKTKSTVYIYGFLSGELVDSKTDYCKDSSTLIEAWMDCIWLKTDKAYWTEKNCNDYDQYGDWHFYCTSTEVRKHRRFFNYGCSDGACKVLSNNWVDDQLVSKKGYDNYCGVLADHVGDDGCTKCQHGDYDCDVDSECTSGLECMGPIGGAADGCCYSSETWDTSRMECCECTSGACCDGCHYRSSSYVCNTDTGNRRYKCDGNCLDNDVLGQKEVQYCSGSSASCTGSKQWSGQYTEQSCSSSQFCKGSTSWGSTKPTCATPQCTSGVCCDTTCGVYKFKPSTTVCDTGSENKCVQGTGCSNDYFKRSKTQYCSGSATDCSGQVIYGGWQVEDDCTKYEKCSDSNGCYCSETCLPQCDGTSCSSCSTACSVPTYGKTNMCGGSQYYKKTIPSTYTSCDIEWVIMADLEAYLQLSAEDTTNDCPGTGTWSCVDDDEFVVEGKNQYRCLFKSLPPGTYYAAVGTLGCRGVYDISVSLENCQGQPCDCTSWQNQGCGQGSCPSSQMYQTRTCTPSGCDDESRCIDDLGCAIICSSNSDCGTDGWVGYPKCDYLGNPQNDVYQLWRTYTCMNPGTPSSYCTNSNVEKLKQDCGDDSYGSNYCYDNDVYRDFTDRGCLNGACFATTTKQKVQECGIAGCNNGVCVSCSCTSWQNKGCGLGGCASTKMYQTRSCSPSGCDSESRCVDDPSCLPKCQGTDISCGIYPNCANCNNGDGCYYSWFSGDHYKDYYCKSNSEGCKYTVDYCNDCSCSCGGYNKDESVANGNCADGKDNDCDGKKDADDSGCKVCVDECSAGQKRCNGNYKQTCGNYDADSCLEWGGDVFCQYGCKDGECLPPETCQGTDISCGIYPNCANCNNGDGCYYSWFSGDHYKDYYCKSNSEGCKYTVDYCNDCSCSCGGYNKDESVANGNCADGKDNDCDGKKDGDDSGCKVIVPCYSNLNCASSEFCKFDLGKCVGPGFCTAKPSICPLIYDPVCGCDGKTYSNECEANRVGVSIKHKGECGVCSKNSDCGIDSWTGNPFCQNDNVWQTWKNYICINPGTQDSYCTSSEEDKLKQECELGCENGQCKVLSHERFGEIKQWTKGHGIGSSNQFLADVNGDSMEDSIIYYSGEWWVELSDGNKFLGMKQWTKGHGIGSSNQILGDVNGDGKADSIVFFSSTGNWWVELSDGNKFLAMSRWATGHGIGSSNQMLGDVDGDGDDDAVIFNNGKWEVALSDGSKFDAIKQWAIGHGIGSSNQMLGDVNGDGKDDSIVFFSKTGDWWVELSDGSKFLGMSRWATGHGIGSENQFLADVNGDGKDDSIIYYHGEWWVELSDGNKFLSMKQWKKGHGIGSSKRFLADVNGDSMEDAIVFFKGDGSWYVALVE